MIYKHPQEKLLELIVSSSIHSEYVDLFNLIAATIGIGHALCIFGKNGKTVTSIKGS